MSRDTSRQAETPAQAGRPTRAETETSVWEWAVSGLSVLLVVSAIGYVFWKAATEARTPPQVVIEVEDVYAGTGGYVVTFWARNVGATTAKDLSIEAELRDGSNVIATRSTAIGFVPAESRRRAGVFFPVDPRRYTLDVHPVGFDLP